MCSFVEANVTLAKATDTVALATDSLEKVKKTHDEEVTKLWEELLKENASREEAWKALEEKRRIHEENLQSEKVAVELAIKEEKGLRGASETRVSFKKQTHSSKRVRLLSTKTELRSVLP